MLLIMINPGKFEVILYQNEINVNKIFGVIEFDIKSYYFHAVVIVVIILILSLRPRIT